MSKTIHDVDYNDMIEKQFYKILFIRMNEWYSIRYMRKKRNKENKNK